MNSGDAAAGQNDLHVLWKTGITQEIHQHIAVHDSSSHGGAIHAHMHKTKKFRCTSRVNVSAVEPGLVQHLEQSSKRNSVIINVKGLQSPVNARLNGVEQQRAVMGKAAQRLTKRHD